MPTCDQAQAQFCHVNRRPGCLFSALNELVSPEEYSRQLGRNWQNSIGAARQIGNEMSVTADYIYTQGRNEKDIIDNVNLTYNPATGAPYLFSDVSRRAFPDWGTIWLLVRDGKSAYSSPRRTVWTCDCSRPFRSGGHARIDLMAEMFNLFIVENVTLIIEEGRRDCGEPEAGQYRTMPFGFRVSF